ncbi:uncharacterized protein F4817DRAFT_263320 [Daldinia loculata]|uniref:uncharacterized protein n=1 Tax=Daldinia loculata TaxID=103429 RepID=UPI0020C42752|nr:uncharacterized protein F4817DRAFT_263320 [Daldinia loculata]KAI1650514.1 hypothetical protein F4817DRAFT_263320 [Daldinia loculata]
MTKVEFNLMTRMTIVWSQLIRSFTWTTPFGMVCGASLSSLFLGLTTTRTTCNILQQFQFSFNLYLFLAVLSDRTCIIHLLSALLGPFLQQWGIDQHPDLVTTWYSLGYLYTPNFSMKKTQRHAEVPEALQ